MKNPKQIQIQKRLQLGRQTIRDLTARELALVPGGKTLPTAHSEGTRPDAGCTSSE